MRSRLGICSTLSAMPTLAPSSSRVALNKLAEELRTREPKLTKEQAFTEVYTGPHIGS
jgi:hypothetical protein